jgi:hypothetical protein
MHDLDMPQDDGGASVGAAMLQHALADLQPKEENFLPRT